MLRHSIPHCLACALATLPMWPLPGLAASAAQSATLAPAVAPLTPAEYRRQLEEYTAARRKYEGEADTYWSSIAQMRRIRNAKRRADKDVVPEDYVLAQPPVYAGPPKPVDPTPAAENEPPPRAYVPVVADFLQSAARHFAFVPRQTAIRAGLQTRLRRGGGRRRHHARAGRAHLRLRVRRQRQI